MSSFEILAMVTAPDSYDSAKMYPALCGRTWDDTAVGTGTSVRIKTFAHTTLVDFICGLLIVCSFRLKPLKLISGLVVIWVKIDGILFLKTASFREYSQNYDFNYSNVYPIKFAPP